MAKPVIQEESRFAECRRRVEACGGRHIEGKQVLGGTFSHWICCPDCPNREETNSPTKPGGSETHRGPISRSLP
jgi:hypothetical protein